MVKPAIAALLHSNKGPFLEELEALVSRFRDAGLDVAAVGGALMQFTSLILISEGVTDEEVIGRGAMLAFIAVRDALLEAPIDA